MNTTGAALQFQLKMGLTPLKNSRYYFSPPNHPGSPSPPESFLMTRTLQRDLSEAGQS